MQRFLFNEMREVIESEDVDTGGMFDWTVGVVKTDKGYRAFVETGWGSGAMGKTFTTIKKARDDIERLMNKV